MVIFVAVVEKVLLTLLPRVVIAAIETTMISATITAYSTASGAILIRQECTEIFFNKVHIVLICRVFEQIKTESTNSAHITTVFRKQ